MLNLVMTNKSHSFITMDAKCMYPTVQLDPLLSILLIMKFFKSSLSKKLSLSQTFFLSFGPRNHRCSKLSEM